MTSKTIFNMNTKLKKAAMKKARAEGCTLSAVLNLATQAYVDDRIGFDVLPPHIVQGIKDIREGRGIPIEVIEAEMALQKKSR